GIALEQRSGLARERIGRARRAEREPVLGVKAVLVLRGGAARLAEGVIGEHLAGTGGVRIDTVEDAAPALVLVHAELDEMAQVPSRLRAAKRHRMADAGALAALPACDERLVRAFFVGAP